MVAAIRDSLPTEQQSELQALFQRGAYEDIVDFCRDSLGEGEYRDFLTRTLDIGQPSKLHRAIVHLSVPAILTSNYDRLIESAHATLKGYLARVLTCQDTTSLWKHLAKRELFILKVHGDITRPDTVVFTSRDYTKHVFGNLAFMTFLQRLILGHSILFIGSSLSDVYMRRILEETTYITGGVGMPHFALLPNPGSIQSRILRDRYNIRVISYNPGPEGDHEPAVLEVLSGLKDATSNAGTSA
jgi:hypothetical protein